MIEDLKYYSGKKPKAFILNEKKYETSAWSEMAIQLFDLLYEYDSQIFENLASMKYKNPKSPLVAKNEYDILNRSKKLTRAEIYIEMHHNSGSFIRFMLNILKEYGLAEKFEIIVGE